MATAEEIMAAVRAADEAKIESRASAAARVGELATERAEAARRVSELDDDLRQAVKEAEAVMTLDELATFANLPEDDVRAWTGSTSKRKPKRGQSGAAGGGRRTTSARRRPVPEVDRKAEPSATTAADAPAEASTSEPTPAAAAV